jgi:DNA-binding NarL/FixJ family response regulator
VESIDAIRNVRSEEPKPGRIRIVIADDHPIVRVGLRKLLSLEPDFEVVGEASDGFDALSKVRDMDPDVLLLDLRMPSMDGLATLEALREAKGRTRVIALTGLEDPRGWAQAMQMGCSGVLMKQAHPDLISKIIRKVHGGETCGITAQFANAPHEIQRNAITNKVAGLTARENEVVTLVVQGYSNKEIASKMSISEQTVKNHLNSIFQKLSITTRLELLLHAIRHSAG